MKKFRHDINIDRHLLFIAIVDEVGLEKSFDIYECYLKLKKRFKKFEVTKQYNTKWMAFKGEDDDI